MILFASLIVLMTLIALGFVFSRSIVITILFLILVTLSWFQWGGKKDILQWLELKQNAEAASHLRKELNNDPKKIIARLEEQLQKNPKNAKGWQLLGKLYIAQQEFSEAENVFAKANQLEPNNADIMMDYAQTLFLIKKSKQATQLARKVLTQDTQNPRAINLLASDAFQKGDYQEAINQWKKLRSYYPFGSEDSNALEAAIAQAKSKLP